jgi:ABC-type lipopolysaccharide export system ATPase subunit
MQEYGANMAVVAVLVQGAINMVEKLVAGVDTCRVSLLPVVNLYRSRVGIGWLAQETTEFILVRASEE